MEAPSEGYVEGIVEMAGLKYCRSVTTPGTKTRNLTDADEAPVTREEHRLYRQIVGKGQFMVDRRPETLFAIKELGRHMHQPRSIDMEAMKRYVRYLKGHGDSQLILQADGREQHRLQGYTDTDWAGCIGSRKSTSCGLIFWSGVLIHQYSRTQSVIALSSPEAEYYGCCGCTAEMILIQSLLEDMGYKVQLDLYCDASAAKDIASRRGIGKVRHMEVKYLWLQEKIASQAVRIHKIDGKQNPADIGTKHNDAKSMWKCCEMIGLRIAQTYRTDENDTYKDAELNVIYQNDRIRDRHSPFGHPERTSPLWRNILWKIYSRFAQHQLSRYDQILNKYYGHEPELYDALRKRYDFNDNDFLMDGGESSESEDVEVNYTATETVDPAPSKERPRDRNKRLKLTVDTSTMTRGACRICGQETNPPHWGNECPMNPKRKISPHKT